MRRLCERISVEVDTSPPSLWLDFGSLETSTCFLRKEASLRSKSRNHSVLGTMYFCDTSIGSISKRTVLQCVRVFALWRGLHRTCRCLLMRRSDSHSPSPRFMCYSSRHLSAACGTCCLMVGMLRRRRLPLTSQNQYVNVASSFEIFGSHQAFQICTVTRDTCSSFLVRPPQSWPQQRWEQHASDAAFSFSNESQTFTVHG